MPALKEFKVVKPLSKVHSEFVSVDYEFAKDGGAVSAIDIFQAGCALLVLRAYIVGVESLTSGGSATVSVGKAGDLTGLVAATGIANLEAGEVAFPVAADLASNVVAKDAIVQMDIATAALTGGKCRFVFEVLAL